MLFGPFKEGQKEGTQTSTHQTWSIPDAVGIHPIRDHAAGTNCRYTWVLETGDHYCVPHLDDDLNTFLSQCTEVFALLDLTRLFSLLWRYLGVQMEEWKWWLRCWIRLDTSFWDQSRKPSWKSGGKLLTSFDSSLLFFFTWFFYHSSILLLELLFGIFDSLFPSLTSSPFSEVACPQAPSWRGV